MMRGSILFTLLLNTILASEVKNIDLQKSLKFSRGLEQDFNLYGSCQLGVISFFENEVNAAKACAGEKDYRCYKACQFKEMGISESTGKIDKNKFVKHMNEKLAKFKDVVTNYVSNITDCLSDNGKTVVLSNTQDQCFKNEAYLKCTIKMHYKNCRPPSLTPPEVPTTLQ